MRRFRWSGSGGHGRVGLTAFDGLSGLSTLKGHLHMYNIPKNVNLATRALAKIGTYEQRDLKKGGAYMRH